MSQMRLTCEGVGSIMIKSTGFRSPMTGTISSAQTKMMLQHFPVRASQQNIVFNVITNGWPELRKIQDFVRAHQRRAMATAAHPEIILWWPERGIQNWSGFIEKMPAGDKRFNIAPKFDLEFFLVDSLLSEKTYGSSLASDFKDMFKDIGNSVLPGTGGPVDGITPPFIGPVAPVLPNPTGRTSRPGGGGGTF